MPPVPDPSIANDVSDLEAGLSALKQGDYHRAIAQLEATPLPPQHPLTAKAQMGLVVAYTRVGEPLRAAALCQTLCQSENPQLSEWATRTLASLAERHPSIAPLNADASPSSPAADDLTGFTPFDPAAPPDFTDCCSDLTPELTPLQQSVDLPNVRDNAGLGDAGETASRSAPDLAEATLLQNEAMRSGLTARKTAPAVVAKPPSQTSAPASQPAAELPPALEEPLFYPTWRQAGRLKQGKAIGRAKWLELLLLQAGTAVTLFWMVQAIVYNTRLYYSIALTKLPFFGPQRELFNPPVVSILLFLGLLLIASRWLLDGLLTVGYGLQPLSFSKLSMHSPETAQSLQRFCRQQRIPTPALGILPTQAPIAFSYGCLPRFTRTVVSQGLLDQLADDEIATIYASEIGHISSWNVPLMSLVMALLQIPYTVYWLVSHWGDRQQIEILRIAASFVAAISYGVYALLRWLALLLSRQRVDASDRVATELTGNPNGLTRALLKIAIGTAKDVQTQRHTSYLLEGFDLLTPLGQRMATTLGSIYPHAPIESVLAWERTNPDRHWLAINNSHPPTGDRLQRLMQYARHWKLDTELVCGTEPAVSDQPVRPSSLRWKTLLLQGAPFFGLVSGLAIAYLLMTLGWFGRQSGISQLSWMYGDDALLQGLALVGFSIGTFARINSLFPDVPFSNTRSVATPDSLVALLKPVDRLPIDSQTVQLEGKFLGRASIGNRLSQDLLLQTATGMIRLHCLSAWGPIGNLLPQAIHPTALLGQSIIVTGWFRHGATPWIDVETLRTVGGRVSRSGHPLWSTMVGTIAAAWGIYTLFHVSAF